jgi:tetratricopeptide (TPR) repeat protein
MSKTAFARRYALRRAPIRSFVSAASVCLLATAEARAASADSEGCKSAADPDRRIELCTKVILFDEDPDIGAWPYVFRAAAYAEKGQYDEAIDDYDAALRLTPRQPVALVGRCSAPDKEGRRGDRSCSVLRSANDGIAYNNRCLRARRSQNDER